MPYLKNTLNHGIDPTGSRRIAPGEVFEVSDDEKKVYSSLDGVESASKSDYTDHSDSLVGPNSDSTPGIDRNLALAEGFAALGGEISADLQVVVGDDQAPYGPPTGVRSTKVAEAEKGVAERIAFADHEALHKVPEPDEKLTAHGVPVSSVVHNAQADAKAEVNDRAQEIVDEYDNEPTGDEAPDPEPQPEPDAEPQPS